jgi:hypothetical protein
MGIVRYSEKLSFTTASSTRLPAISVAPYFPTKQKFLLGHREQLPSTVAVSGQIRQADIVLILFPLTDMASGAILNAIQCIE